MDDLTEYEKQRAARLAENQAMLQSLGLAKAAQEFEQVVCREEVLAEQQFQEAEERLRIESLALSGGVRRSTRLRGKGNADEGLGRAESLVGAGTRSGKKRSISGALISSPEAELHSGISGAFTHLEVEEREFGEQDGEENSDGERSEEDYQPELDELSHEEESDREVAEAPLESKPEDVEEAGGKKRRKKSLQKSSGRRPRRSSGAQGWEVETAAETDDDERALQEALALSLNDMHIPPPAKPTPTKTLASKPSTGQRAEAKGPKGRDPEGNSHVDPSTSLLHEEIRNLQKTQTGPLRAAQSRFAEQRRLISDGRVGLERQVTDNQLGSGGAEERTRGVEDAKEMEGGNSVTGLEAGLGIGLRDGQDGGATGVTPETEPKNGLTEGGAVGPVEGSRYDQEGVNAEVQQREGRGGKGRKGKGKKAPALPPTLEEVDAIFAIFDDRGCGQLSVSEVRHVAEAHDFTWSEEQIADMVGMFDANHDGLLGQDDFRYLVERCRVVLT